VGYYTEYNLSYDTPPDLRELVEKYIKENKELDYALNERQPTKWYKWEKDMQAMSNYFPSITFILEGHGEEFDDIWRASCKNGEIQVTKATITF